VHEHVLNCVTRSNYGPILHNFRDKEIFRSKIAFFDIPPAFDAPVRKARPNIAITFGVEKLVMGQVVKMFDTGMFNRVDIIGPTGV